MKINFSKAILEDLDGNQILDNDGKPVAADYKHLANALFIASSEQVGLSNLDKLDIAQKINKGEVVDLEEKEQALLKEFINRMTGTNGVHAAAWLKLLK